MKRPFVQSDIWAEFQESLGRTVVRDAGDGWSYLAVLEKGKINSRLYAAYGPVIERPDALIPALASLKQKAKDLGASFVRIEPVGDVSRVDLVDAGLRRTNRVQPEATSVVDLSQSEDELIAHMAQNNRNLHRTFQAKGLSLHVSHNPDHISILLKLLHGVAERTGMRPYADSYLRQQAELFLPRKKAHIYFVALDESPIAAAFVFEEGDTLYYAHAAADYEHRKLNAGTVLVSQMMVAAQAKGLKFLDLYGIWTHPKEGSTQAGITRFKRSFGGKDVVYVGAWELPVKTTSYAAYRALSRFARKRV